MAEETQISANTGIVTITTGTSSMTGTGSSLVLTAGLSAAGWKGTVVKKAIIKAVGNPARGMIRFFVNDGTNYRLIKEIDVIPVTKASINMSFEADCELNYALKPGYKLYVSTENTATFNIIVEALDWTYYSTSVRPDTTQFTANTGIASNATANSNLDGTGTLVTAYTAGSSATYKGSAIETITIKATVSNTPGMVRLFIYNGTTNFLFREVVIPSITKTATDKACDYTIVLDDNFDLKAGYLIKASTEKAENFNVMVEGKDWNYPA